MTSEQIDKYRKRYYVGLLKKNANETRGKKLNPYEKECVGEAERLDALLEKLDLTFADFVRISLKKMEEENND